MYNSNVISLQSNLAQLKLKVLAEYTTMRHNYDVFEKFQDGSTLWRACVCGRYETERKIQELKELSENEFYAIDIQADGLFLENVATHSRPASKAAAAR